MICGQMLPAAVALRICAHGACGIGARQRRSPTGGAAYGMPRNLRTVPVALPRTGPLSVITTSGLVGVGDDVGVSDGSAVDVSVELAAAVGVALGVAVAVKVAVAVVDAVAVWVAVAVGGGEG